MNIHQQVVGHGGDQYLEAVKWSLVEAEGTDEPPGVLRHVGLCQFYNLYLWRKGTNGQPRLAAIHLYDSIHQRMLADDLHHRLFDRVCGNICAERNQSRKIVQRGIGGCGLVHEHARLSRGQGEGKITIDLPFGR